MIQEQSIVSTLAYLTIIVGYSFLFVVWIYTRQKLVPIIRYLLFGMIVFIGTLKSSEFLEGIDVFNWYLIFHYAVMALIYFVLIGFKLHTDITYTWRIQRIKNIFNWETCKLPIGLLRQKVREKQNERDE